MARRYRSWRGLVAPGDARRGGSRHL